MNTIKVYQIDELPQHIQEKIIDKNRYILVEYWEWWDGVYSCVNEYGIKVKSFDVDKDTIEIEIDHTSLTSHQLMKNYDEKNDFYIDSHNFLKKWSELVRKYSNGLEVDKVDEENEWDFDKEANELEAEYIKTIGENVLIMLENEAEWLTSDECVFDFLRGNEYEYTEDGTQV